MGTHQLEVRFAVCVSVYYCEQAMTYVSRLNGRYTHIICSFAARTMPIILHCLLAHYKSISRFVLIYLHIILCVIFVILCGHVGRVSISDH